MYKDLKILSIITARGGSKRLPQKNIRMLCGKPLIAYAIDASRKSLFVDRTIVSTDSERIAEVAKTHGAEIPFLRPKELAQDNTAHPEVLLHALEHLEKKEGYVPDLVVLLQPTNPFVLSQDIDRAIQKVVEEKTNSCIPLSPVGERPEHMYRIGENIFEPLMKRKKRETRDQELPRYYRLNGSVFVTRREVLEKEKKIIDDSNTSYIIMPRERSIDINEEMDFLIAEKLIEQNLQEDITGAG